MITHEQAQQLHQCIGQAIEQDGDWRVALEQALEVAAILVSDTMEGRDPDPQVSFDPCITGTVEIDGVKSEFMLPLDDDSVRYSQWGADNTVLWPRVDLMDGLAGAAREWALDNLRAGEFEEDSDD